MSTLFSTPIVRLCFSKLEGLIIRLVDIVQYFPRRLLRIFRHFFLKIQTIFRSPRQILEVGQHLFWFTELFFYLLDLLGAGEVYETLADIVKFNTRPLTSSEAQAVREIFGDQLSIRRIRIDEYAFGGPKSHHFAYVSFYTINSWGALSKETFVHEMMHIWQYVQMGSVYIPRALSAQFSEEGYDYGGLSKLVKAVQSGKGLHDFNLEQQGDIIADYFRIKEGHHPRWSLSNQEDLWVFEELLTDLKVGEKAVAT